MDTQTNTTFAAQRFGAGSGFIIWNWTSRDDHFVCRGDAALLGSLPDGRAAFVAAVQPNQRPALEDALDRADRDGESFTLECRAVNGAWLAIRGAASDHDGVRCVTGVVIDIGTLKMAPDVRDAAALRREADAARTDFDAFAYAVSHDLRAPLRAIGGFSEVLLESEPGTLEASARQYLPRIVTATRRMAELLDNLLQLSRYNRAELHPDRLDLAAMARDIAGALNARPGGRTVEFIAPDHAPAWGDPNLLHAVLERLLDNAWKFTAHTDAPRVEFDAVPTGQGTVFRVCDNGAGFDPAQSGRLFQPLQRLHRAGMFEGSGVGLTIVKRIVERHGGSVSAEGALEQGACFRFVLPDPPDTTNT